MDMLLEEKVLGRNIVDGAVKIYEACVLETTDKG
jgi:hypothetical protein